MKKLLFLPLALFATVNDPFEIRLSSGYRADHIHWHQGEVYSEEYKLIQFWENDLGFRVVYRDLLVKLQGGYSAFGTGTMLQRPSEEQFSTNGWAADGLGLVGYTVELTPDRTYKVLFIPLGGFSGHYETLNPKDYNQTWYGFFLGGGFRFEPSGPLLFDIGYAYNWLHLCAKEHYTLVNGWGSHGHTGWAEIDYRFAKLWSIGLTGNINYFFSPHEGADQFKIRFTNVSGLVTLSREL